MPEKTKVRIVTPSRNLIVVRGVTINYDQTPAEAIKDFHDSDPFIASDYPQSLWNEGKAGIVEGVNVPIYRAPYGSFSTKRVRATLAKKIGYGLPVELVALKNEEICNGLWSQGIWWVLAIRSNDEEIWRLPENDLKAIILSTSPTRRGFFLVNIDRPWNDGDGFIGAPQVPHE